jgi:nucleoporin p58/p45
LFLACLKLTTPSGGLSQPAAQPQQQAPAVGLTLGQSTAGQQQAVPGVRIDLSNIKSTTRFNDLQESLQKEIAMLDEAIQKCIKDKDAVDAFLPSHGEQLAAIPTDVSFVSRKSEGAHNALASDILAIDQLRELVKQDADHARLSFKAIDNLKLPTQYHQAGLWSNRGQQVGAGGGGGGAGGAADAESNTDLISFFSRTADEMDDMMRKFERNLGEIEVHLHGVQGNMLEQMQRVAAQSKSASQGGVDERVLELAAVLRDFEESILKVAGVVGGVKEGVTELQLKDFMGHGS